MMFDIKNLQKFDDTQDMLFYESDVTGKHYTVIQREQHGSRYTLLVETINHEDYDIDEEFFDFKKFSQVIDKIEQIEKGGR